MSSRVDEDRISSAQETLDSKILFSFCSVGGWVVDGFVVVLHDISQLLNTKLDKETLATCVGMIESGVNPEALAVRAFSLIKPLDELAINQNWNNCSIRLLSMSLEERARH